MKLKQKRVFLGMAHQHSSSQEVKHLLCEQPMTRRAALREFVGLSLLGGGVTFILVTGCGSPTPTHASFNALAPTPIVHSTPLGKAFYTYRQCVGSVSGVAGHPTASFLPLDFNGAGTGLAGCY